MTKHINGIDEVLSKMRTLSDARRQKNAALRAGRRAMAPVRKAAIANAKAVDDPNSPEQIWRNIAMTTGRTRRSFALVRVGVRGGARSYMHTRENVRKGRVGKKYATDGSKTNPGGDTWYWRLVEFGTSRVRARPFMRIALYDNVAQVEGDFTDEYKAQLDKELGK